MSPPAPPTRPCDLPYPNKPGQLPAQGDLSKSLDGGEFFTLAGSDYGDRDKLAAEGGANIDWAQAHCIAGKPPAAKADPANKLQ